jgi:hypothetical protein
MHCARWTAKKPSWVYDSGDFFWGRDPALSGLETWSLPLASPNGATACSQRLQPGRSYVADWWCIVFFQFQCCDMSSNLLLVEPENSRNSADSTTGWTQLHKTTLASQGGGCRRERATGKWGTDKHTQARRATSPLQPHARKGPKKASSWLVCAGTARRLHLLGGSMYPQFSGTSEGMAEPVPI